MSEFKLLIEGMHCGGCVKRVTKALEQVPGVDVKSVEVGSAVGSMDASIASVKELLEALTKAGYPAKLGELG